MWATNITPSPTVTFCTKLSLQSVNEFLPKFGDLWCNDGGAVGLVRVVGEIFLVIIFARPEFVERSYLGHDRIRVNALSGDLGDDFFGNTFLLIRMVKDGRTVRGADVVALAV